MDIGNIFYWIALGLVAGALAKFLLPGRDPGGCLITIILGIAGAVLGGWVGTKFLGTGTVTGSFDIRSLGVATGGSILLLILYRVIKR